MKKFNKIAKEDVSNVLPVIPVISSPVTASEPIIATPIITASEPKTEISELEKIRNENKANLEKLAIVEKTLAEISKKKAPGFVKTGVCAHEVLFGDLVKSLTPEIIVMTETDYLKLPDYAILASKAMSVSGSKSYRKTSAEIDTKYFKRSLDALRVRYDLIEKPTAPVAEVLPVIADVKA